jgi:hypothetical protein
LSTSLIVNDSTFQVFATRAVVERKLKAGPSSYFLQPVNDAPIMRIMEKMFFVVIVLDLELIDIIYKNTVFKCRAKISCHNVRQN